MSPLTEAQERTLRHMLGIDKPQHRVPAPYRNHYCANAGDPMMRSLAELGLVERRGTHFEFEAWVCTEAGKLAAMRSHRKIRWPKKKRLYWRYLGIADVCPDLTFHAFLTRGSWAEERRLA